MAKLRVLEPGVLTTVQDLGRFGHAMLGVSASGAADPVSLRVGNLLVGNDPGAAALEMTLLGGAFACDAPAMVAITGSDFEPVLEGVAGGSRRVALWSASRMEPGETLRVGPTRSGARCYISVRGGLEVPLVLGSASTHLLASFGGFHGRALRKGDVLEIGSRAAGPERGLATPAETIEQILSRRILRVTAGAQSGWFTPESVEEFFRAAYQVTEEADRMGLRLKGPDLRRAESRQMITEGVSAGTVQVPESGQPILLFVEQQTTGGYPKIASVISADLPAVGQLRPRDRVQFEMVSLAKAHEILREQEGLLAAALEPA